MKLCRACKETKPLDQFKQRTYKGLKKPQSKCKPCLRAYERAQYHNDPRRQEKIRAQSIWKNKRDKERMAIDPAYRDFLRMRYAAWNLKVPLEEVKKVWGNKVCQICGVKPKRLMTDHNHDTGKVRGRLCAQCNWMLGFAKDKPELLRKGAEYLESTEVS